MPPWHLHADVWVLVAVLFFGYRLAVGRRRPEGAERPTRRQEGLYAAGVVALWAGADWPVHDLSEGYLLSVHMTQHLLFTFVAPPLLLMGTPTWLLRRLVSPVLPIVRRAAHPLVAGVSFNALIVFTHWPVIVDLALRHEPVHFLVHAALVVSAVLMWLPVLSPLAEVKRLSDPGRMVYLFLQSVVPTVPASFLTFADGAVYKFYERAPRIWGLSVVEDQQLAGAIMKLGGGALLWGTIFVIFFRWYQRIDREDRARRAAVATAAAVAAPDPVLTWADVERELIATEAQAPQEP